MREQLPELTSTRFFAATAVLLGHFLPFGIPVGLGVALTGGFGVTFFFVLSGFILTYRYWDDFAGGVGAGAYRRYFVARVARVYPSYALALVLLTLLYLVLNAMRPGQIEYPANTVSSWLWNLAALQTFARTYATQQYWNAPGWSISTELAFYVMCPVILALVARYCRTLGSLLGVLGIAVAWAVVSQGAMLKLVLRDGWDPAYWLDMIASRNIFWRLPEFLSGIAAARLLYGGHLPALASRRARNALLLGGLGLVVLLNLVPSPDDELLRIVTDRLRAHVGYLLPFVAIIVALGAGPTFLSPVLRRRTLVFLGEASYAIYIYHWIPWTALMRAQANGYDFPPGLVTGVILLTIVFAAASYLLYERPARAWIRRLAQEKGRQG